MDNNAAIKRFMKRMIVLIVLICIALVFGLFFAFGGNNPLLYHVANVIDMVLVAITVLFVLGFVYWAYTMVTGKGRKGIKRTPSQQSVHIAQ